MKPTLLSKPIKNYHNSSCQSAGDQKGKGKKMREKNNMYILFEVLDVNIYGVETFPATTSTFFFFSFFFYFLVVVLGGSTVINLTLMVNSLDTLCNVWLTDDGIEIKGLNYPMYLYVWCVWPDIFLFLVGGWRI